MTTNTKFGKCDQSSSRTTSNFVEGFEEMQNLDTLRSFEGLLLNEATSKLKKKRKRNRKSDKKSQKINGKQNLDDVDNKKQDLFKTPKDEDIIDEVFKEFANNTVHPIPKIKFNFSILLSSTEKENNVVQIPKVLVEVPVKSEKITSKDIMPEENEKKQRVKMKNINKPISLKTEAKQIINDRSPDTLNKNKSTIPPNKKKIKKSEKIKLKKEECFEAYLTEDEVALGLSSGLMLMGTIRINQRNFREAYISSSKDGDKDFLIEGVADRNRALEGDEVVVLINPEDRWKNTSCGLQKTVKVVRISEYIHPRSCVGLLKLENRIQCEDFYDFYPKDSKIPRLKIHPHKMPKEVLQNPEKYTNMIWFARIDEWDKIDYANGTNLKMIGTSGDLESETIALMLDNNLDPEPVPAELEVCYPKLPFVIPAEELDKRNDLRNECIFTIDPASARDLDDAMSCKVLSNGNFEVGVHISDVTYFLKNETPLDDAVRERATTVYLVQRVYHMLPVELCMLCSLTPGEDKLAFSVIFEITPDAEVVNQRFCRSVIRSCSKFAYEHAQMIIDNPEKEWNREDFPEIENGFGPADCKRAVIYLYKLSLIMRERRFSTGALRLDMPKLCFTLDHETNRPISCFIYENKESHRLIEEFMLLANMATAEYIYKIYPELAFLRNHCPPQLRLMDDLQKKLSKLGINLDVSSAGTIHSSLKKYLPATASDHFEWLRSAVLYNLCSRPMKRALYFNPDSKMEKKEFHHFALNSPLYTHFTSPIRRYADVMVHRLLGAAIGYDPPPSWTVDFSKKIAQNCNLKKHSAKVAGDQSSKLFLALYLEEQGPIVTQAGVFDVKENSFDCIVYGFGITLRVYTNQCLAKTTFSAENGMSTLKLEWNGKVKQIIQILSVINIRISKSKDLKVEGVLLPPS